MKIKTGDKVIILSGKEKGKTGTVYKAFPRRDEVVIEGMNTATKHQKNRRIKSQGQVVEVPMPIHISNVALVEGEKPVRAGFKLENDKKVRISRQSGKII